MRKHKVLETVQLMPDDFNLDELIEKVIFIEKVEQGIKQGEEGKVVSHDQVKDMVKKW
ncbi:MAG: hypothetical protein KI791_18410 [Cyclobacteriaceae bacterium]|nr:hypothetical protein [Cyclobacteriaceae bacterium SS2]